MPSANTKAPPPPAATARMSGGSALHVFRRPPLMADGNRAVSLRQPDDAAGAVSAAKSGGSSSRVSLCRIFGASMRKRRGAERVAESSGRREALRRFFRQRFQQCGFDAVNRGRARAGSADPAAWLICACIRSYSLVALNGGAPDSIS